jgi:leukotriene-A4 hydrolase
MQDTPAVKMTYDANVTIPNDLRAKMSANSTGFKEINKTHTMFMFRNDIKIPSYLIALAVGDLKYHSLGRRVGVISEPA